MPTASRKGTSLNRPKTQPNSIRGFLFVLIFAGCAARAHYLIPDFQPPQKVAVLLFSNETNDIIAPDIVRKLLVEVLPRHGYVPMKMEEVDEILKQKFGILEGGQLGSATAQEIGKKLGVDGLFYGNVVTFQDLPLGYVRKRTVKADLRLVDAATGKLLWQEERSWTNPEVHFNADEAKRAGALQVIDRQMRRTKGTYLREETIIMLERALTTLPVSK